MGRSHLDSMGACRRGLSALLLLLSLFCFVETARAFPSLGKIAKMTNKVSKIVAKDVDVIEMAEKVNDLLDAKGPRGQRSKSDKDDCAKHPTTCRRAIEERVRLKTLASASGRPGGPATVETDDEPTPVVPEMPEDWNGPGRAARLRQAKRSAGWIPGVSDPVVPDPVGRHTNKTQALPVVSNSASGSGSSDSATPYSLNDFFPDRSPVLQTEQAFRSAKKIKPSKVGSSASESASNSSSSSSGSSSDSDCVGICDGKVEDSGASIKAPMDLWGG